MKKVSPWLMVRRVVEIKKDPDHPAYVNDKTEINGFKLFPTL